MIDGKYAIVQTDAGRHLHITGELPSGFEGTPAGDGYDCPLNATNAAALRQALPWTAAQAVGLRKSFGCGDRLGIATAGHLRAVVEGDMFPVLAQQSIREMQRARRDAQSVMDDATWGVLEADYRDGFGCDADHLKTIEDIETCIAAGFMSFTLDPGDYVDNDAEHDAQPALEAKVRDLPWDALQSDPDTNRAYHADLTEIEYLRAAAKYGRVIARVTEMAAAIAEGMSDREVDLEVSVDETASVTTLAEHRYIARELKRLGIPFTGLAPRFVGSFEKGVDYIGDLDAFEASYKQHAALAEELGPYKLSIHSGSDKLSIYPIIARYSDPYVHVKTSGTSWLEALRVIAMKNPALFREILALAIEGYDANRASYHVSADPARIAVPDDDADLPQVLDDFHGREVLHVSFGPVLAAYYDAIYATLYANAEVYAEVLHKHFRKHILPFKTEKAGQPG